MSKREPRFSYQRVAGAPAPHRKVRALAHGHHLLNQLPFRLFGMYIANTVRMKQLLQGSFSIIILFSLLFGSPMPATNGALIEFDKEVHDFGKLVEGEVVTTVFTFKNTGCDPLVITSVEKPCGCLAPVYSKEPIMPGDSGEIHVTLTTKGHPGIFRRTMQVQTNSLQRVPNLMIKGEVVRGQ